MSQGSGRLISNNIYTTEFCDLGLMRLLARRDLMMMMNSVILMTCLPTLNILENLRRLQSLVYRLATLK